MSLSRLKSLLAPLCLILAIFTAYKMVNSRPDLATSEARVSTPKVSVVTVEKGEVAFQLVANGMVEARRKLNLSSEVLGRVIWVSDKFVSGGHVKEGATLVKIDSLRYQVALADAQAILAATQMALADAKVRKQKTAIKESQARMDAAEQRIKQIERDLANTAIQAPFDAIIDSKHVEFGQYINSGMLVAHLLSTDAAEITLPITSSDRVHLNPSQFPEAVVRARYGEIEHQWQGKLVRIELRLDTQTRVFPSIVQVESPYDEKHHQQVLPLGSFVEVELQGVPISNAVKLPKAVLHGSHEVFIIDDNSLLSRRSVVVIKELDDSVIVTQGLNDGEQVVITRLPLMHVGMEVVLGDG